MYDDDDEILVGAKRVHRYILTEAYNPEAYNSVAKLGILGNQSNFTS